MKQICVWQYRRTIWGDFLCAVQWVDDPRYLLSKGQVVDPVREVISYSTATIQNS